MSTVGLTKAMLVALERVRKHAADLWLQPSMAAKLHDRGLVYFVGHMVELTPRGHAALAAPRITKKAYEWLSGIEACEDVGPSEHAYSMYDNGWWQWSGTFRQLTPAGRTALNNVRAAMGSPDWKEGL